jgi:AcrR family transcriptional regulator
MKAVQPTSTIQFDSGKPNARARMLNLLLNSAMALMRAGKIPSVSEVAAAAKVSRATAYRYFPTRSALVAAVVDASLGPVRAWASDSSDGRERLEQLFDATFPRFRDFEAPLRAALQLSQEHWLLARAGELNEEQFKRGHRMTLLDKAAQPLKKSLGTKTYQRLMHATSVIYGIEPYVILKDMWDASDAETVAVTRWMLKALVDAALREAQAAAKKPSKTKAPHKAPH